MMGKKTTDLAALLADLNRERAELDASIEELIADMAEAPPEQRKTGDWAADGASTRRYLELTNRQAAVEREITELARELAAADKPAN